MQRESKGLVGEERFMQCIISQCRDFYTIAGVNGPRRNLDPKTLAHPFYALFMRYAASISLLSLCYGKTSIKGSIQIEESFKLKALRILRYEQRMNSRNESLCLNGRCPIVPPEMLRKLETGQKVSSNAKKIDELSLLNGGRIEKTSFGCG